MYFHGNAEDIGTSYEFALKISLNLRCNVLAVEYPGYGIYKQETPSAEKISENAKIVMEYLLNEI